MAPSGRLQAGLDGLTFGCPECGTEHPPAPCHECGSEDLRGRLDDGGEPVVACRACGTTYDAPPFAG